eukprot:g12651.t1
MLAVSLESASDEAARHRAKAAEEWSYAERHAAWYSLFLLRARLENAELVKLSHHLGRQFHQRLQEPVHVDFGEVLREVKKTHSAVSSDFRMVLAGFHPARVRPMKDFRALVPFAVAILFIVVYFTVLLVRFEDTLSDKCSARIQHFGGEEPETFKHGANWSSACLEFGTHKIGVKQEWSAAWNEISLKAAFLLPAHGDTKDEIELGYLPKEWEVGEAPSTIEHYYAPLIRVPIFQPPLDSHASDGIATRMYLAEQEDHGRHEAGDFWYVYGASSMPVVNATMPEYRFFEKDGEWVRAPKSRRALAHIVITLEDFTKYEYRVQPVIYPLLSLFSQVSGVCALFCWAFFKSPLMGRKLIAEAEEGPSPVSEAGRRPGRVATHQGAEYRTIADAEEEEQQGLLDASTARNPETSPAKDYDEPVSHTSLPPAAEAPAPTAAAVVAVQSAVLGSPMGMEKAHPSTPRKSVRHCATSPGLADKGPNPLGTESENGSSLGLSEGLPFTSAKRGPVDRAISRGRLKRVREFWCQTEPPPVEEMLGTVRGLIVIPIPEPKKSTKPAKKEARVFQDAEAVLGDGENRRRRNSFEQAKADPIWNPTELRQYNVFDYYHKKGCAQYIAKHWLLEYITLAVVCLNTLWIAIDTDNNKASIITNASIEFQIAENFFCGYFFCELLIRFLAFQSKRYCFQDYWFNFDLLLVVLMVAETWIVPLVFNLLRFNEEEKQTRWNSIDGPCQAENADLANAVNIDFLRILRLVRILRLSRMAKLLRAVPELVIIIKGIGFAAGLSDRGSQSMCPRIIYVFAIVLRQTTDGFDFGSKYFNSTTNAMATLLSLVFDAVLRVDSLSVRTGGGAGWA